MSLGREAEVRPKLPLDWVWVSHGMASAARAWARLRAKAT